MLKSGHQTKQGSADDLTAVPVSIIHSLSNAFRTSCAVSMKVVAEKNSSEDILMLVMPVMLNQYV